MWIDKLKSLRGVDTVLLYTHIGQTEIQILNTAYIYIYKINKYMQYL